MEPLLKKSSYVPYPTVPVSGGGGTAPPITDIFGFNKWHAEQIVDAMNSGILGTYFDSKTQLSNLANGVQVKHVNPKTRIVAALPLFITLCKMLKMKTTGKLSLEVSSVIRLAHRAPDIAKGVASTSTTKAETLKPAVPFEWLPIF